MKWTDFILCPEEDIVNCFPEPNCKLLEDIKLLLLFAVIIISDEALDLVLVIVKGLALPVYAKFLVKNSHSDVNVITTDTTRQFLLVWAAKVNEYELFCVVGVNVYISLVVVIEPSDEDKEPIGYDPFWVKVMELIFEPSTEAIVNDAEVFCATFIADELLL